MTLLALLDASLVLAAGLATLGILGLLRWRQLIKLLLLACLRLADDDVRPAREALLEDAVAVALKLLLSLCNNVYEILK